LSTAKIPRRSTPPNFQAGSKKILAGDLRCDGYGRDMQNPDASKREMMVPGAEPIRPLVREAVNMLLVVYEGQDGRSEDEPWSQPTNWWRGDVNEVAAEVRELMGSPLRVPFLNLSVRLFHEQVRYGRPTLYLCRQLTTQASVLFHLCAGGLAFHTPILDGCIRDKDFPRLTVNAGQLAGAPVWLCQAPDEDAFLRVLFAARSGFKHVFCDWTLKPTERDAVCRVTEGAAIEIVELSQESGEESAPAETSGQG